MINLIQDAIKEITTLINTAFKKAVEEKTLIEAEVAPFVTEIPADTSHGDFATNAAMVNAKAFRTAPIKIAAALSENFDFSDCKYVKSAEIAGPGFINFRLAEKWYGDVVTSVLEEKDDYGKTDFGGGKKVMVEFVSANPTGPMHMGNARGGAIGDILADALSYSGHEVTKEFYINDAGNQIAKFGLSLEARYMQHFEGEENVPFPEDGYHGEDIKERAEQYIEKFGDSLVSLSSEERQKKLIDFALPINVAKLKSDLSDYRIEYDVWFKESVLHESGLVNEVIEKLRAKGLIYENEGAIWYKATEFGGEKDEVLVRANGFPTYFAADIAYHYNKFVIRGFDKVINVWGADHHGHVARLKGAMDALSIGGDKLDIVLMQLV
ncbi:MAG: arginine--tRNA ligase, partial [Oscillospiraceae bacterium]